MPKGHAKAPSQRQLRVGEELRHVLAQVLERGEVHDPAVADVPVTVTEVRISPDLKNASVFVIPLGGGPDELNTVLKGLIRAAPFLRRRLAERVHLRYAPRLKFLADETFDNAERIGGILREPQVARDLDTDGATPGEVEDGA